MSKTLSLKEKAPVVAYTADELREMLAILEPPPAHVVADKSVLPPVEERSAAPVQAAPRKWGDHSMTPTQIETSNINPATGFANNQVVPAQKGGTISPPPTRNFR